jgi:putative Mg2+ transporter-C (MgtC) family protein
MPFDLEMLLRLALAAMLGGIIGAEREQANQGAGLRTHALVSTAAALATIVSAYGFMEVLSAGKIVLDPSRVAAQIMSGVGFLGAGIIIFRKNAVRGLTTAASIWAVAAIGLAAGCGLYVIAIGTTGILSFILTAVKKMENKFFPQKHVNRITIQLEPSATKLVGDKLKIDGLKILNMSVQAHKQAKSTLKVEVIAEQNLFVSLFQELQSVPGVATVSYTGRSLPIDDWRSESLEEDAAETPPNF